MICSDYFKGQIVDSSNNPIYNANIEVVGDAMVGTTTDKDGLFVFSNDIDGFFSIKVSHIGYETKILNIDAKYKDDIVIILSDNVLEYDDIVITGTKIQTYIKDIPILTHVISSNDLESSIYNSVKDVLEMSLPNVQNVMSTHAGVSNDRMKIQGLDNKYILFMIDGVRVSGEFAGNLDFSMLNLSNVEKIEIIEGGMSSLYGSSAVGGVVNIITKNDKKPISANFSYIYDNPNVISHNMNLGFNTKIINYSLDYVKQNSDGYDLTLYDDVYQDNIGGTFINTLEKYETKSFSHKIKYNINNKSFIELNHKNYLKDIYLFYEYKVPILYEPWFDYYTAYQYEMPKAEDNKYGFNFQTKKANSSFKVSLNMEEYIKSNTYFDYTGIGCTSEMFYCNDSDDLIKEDFINAIHENKSLNLQYNRDMSNHSLTIGFEKNADTYSSFNIYKYSGDQYENGYELNVCDYPLNYTLTDCEYSSIFGSTDNLKEFNREAFYFGDQIEFSNNNKMNFSLRHIISENYENNTVYSFAYMIKKYQPYDLRFNYTSGFRLPAIKELYYDFQGHSPPVIGDEDLLPTTNNHFSFSIDKRVFNNSFSMELFYNDIHNMIATKSVPYESESSLSESALQYSNFESVIIKGFNCHYDRKINNKNSLKFVYNFTHPSSDNIEALELISKHSFRMNYLHDILVSKLKFSLNMKYSGKKFIFIDDKVWLDDFIIIDGMFIANIKDFINIKFGCKNILDYVDDRRFSSEYLSTYDPGRRYVVQLSFKY